MTHKPPHRFSGQSWTGQRVGILGGSFNPIHAGHVHIAREAIKRLNLDAVWLMVSPQNPFKSNQKAPSLNERVIAIQNYVHHPKIITVTLENEFGTRRSFDTIQKLKTYFPQTKFIWLAGDDIAIEFHHWYKWKELLYQVPFVFFERSFPVKNAPVFLLAQNKNQVLRLRNIPRSPLSSRHLRESQ